MGAVLAAMALPAIWGINLRPMANAFARLVAAAKLAGLTVVGEHAVLVYQQKRVRLVHVRVHQTVVVKLAGLMAALVLAALVYGLKRVTLPGNALKDDYFFLWSL